MNRQMLEVMQRRGELLEKIAAQREMIAATGTRLEAPLGIADKGLAVVRFVRSNPVLVAAVVAALAIRRRSMTTVLVSGWKAWRLYRRAMDFSAKVAERLRPQ